MGKRLCPAFCPAPCSWAEGESWAERGGGFRKRKFVFLGSVEDAKNLRVSGSGIEKGGVLRPSSLRLSVFPVAFIAPRALASIQGAPIAPSGAFFLRVRARVVV